MITGDRQRPMICLSHRTVAYIIFEMALIASIGCRTELSTSLPVPQDQDDRPDPEIVKRSIDEVLQYTINMRRLNTIDHGAWQVLHGVLAFQREFPIQIGRSGEIQPAVDYLLGGGALDGWTLRPWTTFDDGRVGIKAILAPGSKRGQGHADQWLAYLAQCALPADQPLEVAGRTYTISDVIRQIQYDVSTNSENEYSWTLIALSAYLPSNVEWKAADGKMWNIERLVDIELDQDLYASACGGTHRMIGLTVAVNSHLAGGGSITGPWVEAERLIQRCIDDARSMQNPDGSFSAHYFQRPGQSADLATTLGTTGHILEFLSLALSSEQIDQPWVERAAMKLCDSIKSMDDIAPECGALYHAAHGLVLYRERRFGPHTYMTKTEDDSAQTKAVRTSP
jgi:hypothetical protein